MLQGPPNPIPVKVNYQYFSLNQSGPVWDGITKGRNLACVHCRKSMTKTGEHLSVDDQLGEPTNLPFPPEL